MSHPVPTEPTAIVTALRCDADGCAAKLTAEGDDRAARVKLVRLAEDAGWQLAPFSARGAHRDLCPDHHEARVETPLRKLTSLLGGVL